MENNKQIKYENLSVALKIFVILGWITIALTVLGFLLGFFSA